MIRWVGRGTHRGELTGVAPTGNQVAITGITINCISEDKIEETWSNYDTEGMMQQIGAAPCRSRPEPLDSTPSLY